MQNMGASGPDGAPSLEIGAPVTHAASRVDARHDKNLPLAIGALGVVFGDIGTSPLYTMKEAIFGLHGVPATHANVLGILSLVFWALTLVVAFKYIGFVMKADNRGEGGIFALLALLPPVRGKHGGTLVVAALLGAALLYGDGIITPAISVLSAIEGLEVATTALRPAVVPLTVVILLFLFGFQKRGTERIGRLFGPVMAGWFLVLAALGVRGILMHPGVLEAVNPSYAVAFFAHNHFHGFLVLGAVVLCLTGSEALYADLGHFGRRPIRLAWFVLAFPALLLNYAGQGAILLAEPQVENPFFALVPRMLLYPVVAIATLATVIASQALISGAFSLTRQAVQLGYLPRVHIVHTSGETEGQIYIPWVNTALMVACIALVIGFKKSSELAAAYGVAVTANMIITTLLFLEVARLTWKWPMWKTLPLVSIFFVVDFAFFSANLLKVAEGGWLPLAVAVGLVTIMLTWRDGRAELRREVAARTLPLELFLDDVHRREPRRVPGTAVFLSANPVGTPPAMLHHFKHNQTLHEQVVILSVVVSDYVPFVPKGELVHVEELGEGFFRVEARYGFMQTPNVPAVLRKAWRQGLTTDPATTSFVLGRETLLTTGKGRMSRWRKGLFRYLSRNAEPATAYFGLPPGRVIELGMQVEL
ncbi:Kup system potassium uptake protein [Vulgatibacter incomptus]|uniref:Probable potassium transport system protein Kup n=2 Tax=Vulgatibacter incomptus TaxID=1391653 RepID=A0A0K1PFR7_9BACT|nr:Kup system potassium uptake protein [Vulgatibacter incomptus]